MGLAGLPTIEHVHTTLTRDDVDMLARGEQLPPRAAEIGATPAKPVTTPVPAAEPKRNPPLLGGPEPSPA